MELKIHVRQKMATQFNYGSTLACVCGLVVRVPDGAGDVPAGRSWGSNRGTAWPICCCKKAVVRLARPGVPKAVLRGQQARRR